MRIRLASLIVAVAMVAGSTSVVLAQGRGRGNGKTNDKQAAPIIVVSREFAPRDREVIVTYYTQQRPALGDLPPGLEKQPRRNGTLPPGLQKKMQPFPLVLERQLAPLPVGYRRGIVGPHVVIYNTRTNLIVDVVLNIIR